MSPFRVEVDRGDLERLVVHCRETWPSSMIGYDAVTRCEHLLGCRSVWVNLFRMPDGQIAPSVPYRSKREAEAHRNATSFLETISIYASCGQ